ncbi:MAG TPA: serine hydrolase, partial [Candidatus Saccharimonadales bacterium]|nr:serine hydrolase [Candidatus Saccharimonadales bacterium]
MEKSDRSRWKRWLSALLAVVLLVGYVGWALRKPLPQLTPALAASTIKTDVPAGNLAWPAGGQAAVGIKDTQIMQARGTQTPLPIASTAKLITSLSVLKQKPLAPGQQGPLITMTDRDVALYNSYMARDGSVVKVVAGEQISEYQALQAIMLPSANNISDTMAIWAFGSLEAYAAYANEYIKQLGLHDTHVGSDASGLAPDSTSTAQDLVKLGKVAMQNPVLAEIVGQSTAKLPIVNDVKNVNFLLGTDNIVGVKTGNTEEAGGVFVGAARVNINGKPVTIVTAVAGSPT